VTLASLYLLLNPRSSILDPQSSILDHPTLYFPPPSEIYPAWFGKLLGLWWPHRKETKGRTERGIWQ